MHAAARPLHIGLGLGCASVKKAAPGEGFLEYAGSALKVSWICRSRSLERACERIAKPDVPRVRRCKGRFQLREIELWLTPGCSVDRRPDGDVLGCNGGPNLRPLNSASIADGNSLALLLQLVASQDRRAFASLYAASSSKLYGIILRILKRRDVAEDILQDVYVRIWERAMDFDSRKAPAIAWMIAIARNRALDERRRAAVGLDAIDADAEVANVVSEDEDPLAAAERSDNLRRLAECLNKLDKNRRDIVLLAYRDGYSRQELSQRLARPVGTIKTWLHHSLVQLKTCLGQ